MKEKDYLFEIAKLALKMFVAETNEKKEELYTRLACYMFYDIPEELWNKLHDSID